MLEHCEICNNLKKAAQAFKRNYSSTNKFIFELAYANYESSCRQQGVKPLSQDDIENQNKNSEVMFIPFK